MFQEALAQCGADLLSRAASCGAYSPERGPHPSVGFGLGSTWDPVAARFNGSWSILSSVFGDFSDRLRRVGRMGVWRVPVLSQGRQRMGWLLQLGRRVLRMLGQRRKYTALAVSEASSEAASTETLQSLVDEHVDNV